MDIFFAIDYKEYFTLPKSFILISIKIRPGLL